MYVVCIVIFSSLILRRWFVAAGVALVRQMRVSIMGDPSKSRPGASLALTHLPRRTENEVPLLRGAINNMNTYAMVDASISKVEL